ncbi:hypothetical protein JM81_3220 [Maribacter sp. MAR_2009_72]|nr:hypothetical protein JM81_3220 [Maribacter sp. MAR_2009_72]
MDLFLRDINSLSSEKYNGLLNQKDSINVLFLGNSHANYAINPCKIDSFKTYNLANVSQKIYFDKRLTIKAINEGVSNLEYVFISVDYHSLFTSTQGIRDNWTYYANGIKYKDKDYTKVNLSPFLWGYTPKVSLSLLTKTISRKIKYRENNVLNFDVEKFVDIKDTLCNGFIGINGTDISSFNDASYLSKARYLGENTETSERKEVIQDLMEFIEFLKKQNIKPILFSSPTYSEFNKYLDTITVKQNLADIHFLSKKYNIPYWRYNDDARFLKEDFYNQDHLNKKGAEKFSKLINARLNALSN